MNLRDYQQHAHDAALARWGYRPQWDGSAQTYRTLIANLATSAGKTIIAAHLTRTLVEQHGARVLFVADREELIQQPVEKFHKACGLMASVHRGKDSASPNSRVVVASIQTLERRLPPGPAFTHIIDDEAHRGTDARKKIHDAYPSAKVLGITATAFRKNLADLSDWYEHVAFELGTFDLVEQGYITPIKVLTLPLEVDLSGVHQRGGDFNQDEVETILAPEYRAVAKLIREHAADMSILAFLPLIRSSHAFVQILKEEGITARHCDGSSPDRKQILESFERGEFQVLSNSQVFSTGVDFIRCNCLLNLAPTRSKVEYRQRAGRIMRLQPGVIDPGGIILPTAEERRAAIAASRKPFCYVFDLLWQTRKIGLAGPASLFAIDEQDELELEQAIRRKRTPEELLELSKKVQRDREEKLRRELEDAAARQRVAEGKAAILLDARAIGLALHRRDLTDYQPALRWEQSDVSDAQKKKLADLGIGHEQVKCSGHASVLIETATQRIKDGLAPFAAFEQLKAKGVEKPDACTLNEAIRLLKDRFPCTISQKWRGVPLADVSRTFWHWLYFDPYAAPMRKTCETWHPATWRYLTRKVFPKQEAAKQAEAARKAQQAPELLPR